MCGGEGRGDPQFWSSQICSQNKWQSVCVSVARGGGGGLILEFLKSDGTFEISYVATAKQATKATTNQTTNQPY